MAPPESSKSHAEIALRYPHAAFEGKKRGLTASDGSVRKLDHSLVDYLVWEGTDERRADVPLVTAPATQYLRNAVLLAQERLLVHLVE